MKRTKAVEIGKIATVKTTLPENLAALLTGENCQKGMREFLTSFEGGKILSLAAEIGASGNVLGHPCIIRMEAFLFVG